MSSEPSEANDRGPSGAEGPTQSENGETQFATRTFAPTEETSGTVIGSYHLLQPIGQGGMGDVWLAEQQQPVRRRVAIKLIKAGMDTREVVARFESERQALALMDHPAIAKVFEAGSTGQGRPYFVMEYVDGMPFTAYCDKHSLPVRQRLELFVAVCDGVQHAHQKAILHRDLKPSNILVSEVDGKPAPRIIDFGVAKATAQRLTAHTLFTCVGAIVGTPGYMSPEQADSDGTDVDTRTDVYSLGVVLYELLVGVLPLDFSTTPVDQFARRLREEDAPRPSSKLNTLGEQSGMAAKNRGTDPAKLSRQLLGDLDIITLKALEKDRSRRYSTPSELAADIGRYLRDEPLMARPANTWYRVSKYIRRHRIGVAVATAAAVLVVTFAVAQALELRRITHERDRADRITNFMADMFKVSEPSAARGNSITAREILDKASKAIDPGLSKDPELQAQMMQVMGEVYFELGLYPQAQSLLTRAVDIRRRVLGPERAETLVSMNNLGNVLWREGRYPEAEKLDRETLDIRRRVLGPEHPGTLMSMNNLSQVLRNRGRYVEVEKLDRQTLDIRRRVLGPEHPDTLVSMNNLAVVLFTEGSFPEAEKLDRETLDIRRRVLGPEHPDTLSSMPNLGLVLSSEGRFAESEKLQRETLEIKRRVLGPEHPGTLQLMGNLALVLFSAGRFAESEKLQRETLDLRRRVLGPEHSETLGSMSNLAAALNSEGRFAEAEKLCRETLDIQRRVLGPEHPETLISMSSLAVYLISEGRLPEAEKVDRETLDIERRVLGPEHPNTAISTYNLGTIVLTQGKRDEALSLYRQAVEHGLPPYVDLGIDQDPDLKTLHGDPRFAALVADAKERAAAAQRPK